MIEAINDEMLTDEGHKMLISVKRKSHVTMYQIKVFSPQGAQLVHVRTWEVYSMMLVMLEIYKEFEKFFELQILEEIVDEMEQNRRAENSDEPNK